MYFIAKQRVENEQNFERKNQRVGVVTNLPITIIVLLLSVTIRHRYRSAPVVLFLTGAALLIVGMALFSLGTDVSMTPMGEGIGAQLPRTKNLLIVILITLIIGVLITIAEPDLQVLAGQVPNPFEQCVLVGRSRRRCGPLFRAYHAAYAV